MTESSPVGILVLSVLLDFLVTWTVGLTPPLVIRFVLVRRSLWTFALSRDASQLLAIEAPSIYVA